MSEKTIEEFRNEDYEEFIAGLEGFELKAISNIAKTFGVYHDKLKLTLEGTFKGLMDFELIRNDVYDVAPSAVRTTFRSNYYDMSTRLIYALPGLSVTYPVYVEGLKALRDDSLEIYETKLKDLEFWFSRILNATDLLRTASVTAEIDTDVSSKTREIAEHYGMMFAAKHMKDRGPVSDYFERKSEIEETYKAFIELKKDRAYPKPKDVIERINALNEIIGLISLNIEQLDKDSKPNKRTMAGLYEATMSVAEIVELMGLYYAERHKALVAFEQSVIEMRKF